MESKKNFIKIYFLIINLTIFSSLLLKNNFTISAPPESPKTPSKDNKTNNKKHTADKTITDKVPTEKKAKKIASEKETPDKKVTTEKKIDKTITEKTSTLNNYINSPEISGISISDTAISGTAISGTSAYGTSISGTSTYDTNFPEISGTSISGTSISGTSISGTSMSSENISLEETKKPEIQIPADIKQPEPEFPDIKILEQKKKTKKRKLRTIFSMADEPKTIEEKKLIEKEINTSPKAHLNQTPSLTPELIQPSSKSDVIEKNVYLGQYIAPWQNLNIEETVQFDFENAEITELLKFLESTLKITFILDDDIGEERAKTLGLKPIKGTKITFKSNTPISLKQAWDLGLTFLEMAGYSAIPTTTERTYHITANASKSPGTPSANTQPLPTFIGIDPDLLPNSDIKIRYVYFIENAEIETISAVVDSMRSSSSASIIKFPELKAIIITDKSANIKSLIKILKEVDTVDTPETLAIIRLKHADAKEVQDLYASLIGKTDDKGPFAFNRPKKTSTTHYFTDSTRVFAEPRTNSLIILGTHENIKKFEEFIFRYIDKKSDLPYSPLHIYQLKYIEAKATEALLSDLIKNFNADPSRKDAAAVGGVRDGNKFFRPSVKIVAETSSNKLVINADYEDYLKIREVLEKLDVEQPQVAIKVLILDVDLSNLTEFGTQIRNSKACCDGSGGTDSLLGRNVNFQYSGLNGIITRNVTTSSATTSGAERLLGNLINLAATPSGGTGLFPTGSTLVTLGKDIFGFWGLLRALESITRVSVIANPFLITAHKYKAEVTIGETRRVVTAFVQGSSATQQAFGNLDANLSVIITPQISYDDMISLNIWVDVEQFAGGTEEFPTKLVKQLSTEAIVANKEVIALGGLIRDIVSETTTKIPILGDIPLLGWLFKNKVKTIERQSLLILISPEIIKPHEPEVANEFTEYKITEAKRTFYDMESPSEMRDPIHRWLFVDHENQDITRIEQFTANQAKYISAGQRKELDTLLAMDEKKESKQKNLLDMVMPEKPDDLQQGIVT